jgi:hypothetical protein
MRLRKSVGHRVRSLVLALCAGGAVSSLSPVVAQQSLVIEAVAEKKLKQLPAGPLYWRVENVPTLAQARTATGDTVLAAEVSGRVWLFTLGPKGGPRHAPLTPP